MAEGGRRHDGDRFGNDELTFFPSFVLYSPQERDATSPSSVNSSTSTLKRWCTFRVTFTLRFVSPPLSLFPLSLPLPPSFAHILTSPFTLRFLGPRHRLPRLQPSERRKEVRSRKSSRLRSLPSDRSRRGSRGVEIGGGWRGGGFGLDGLSISVLSFGG